MLRLYLLTALLLFPATAWSSQIPETFTVDIGKFHKTYPVVQSKLYSQYYVVKLQDLWDNWSFAEQAAKVMAQRLHQQAFFKDIEVVIAPGESATMHVALLVAELKKYNPHIDICIVRPTRKNGSFKSIQYQPVTSSKPKILYLRHDQFERIQYKKALIFDDIFSTGATTLALKQLIQEANGTVLAYAAIATEDNDITEFDNRQLIKLFNWPVYKIKKQ